MRPSDYNREYVRREFSPLKDPDIILRSPLAPPPKPFEVWPRPLVVALTVLVLGAVAFSSGFVIWAGTAR